MKSWSWYSFMSGPRSAATLSVMRGSRAWASITSSYQAEAEAGVRRGAVAAQFQIPPVGFLGKVLLPDAIAQDVVPLLALAAADDLADPGGEDVHGAHGLVVVVAAHVERFDLFGIVG